MYQINGLDYIGALSALAATEYPLLVIDPVYTVQGSESFNIVSAINVLKTTPTGKRRLILAYIDIGEAEDFRTYWQPDWVSPESGKAGSPDFMVAVDPDGWSGNYPVAFWDDRWRAIWLGNSGLIHQLAAEGFDGVYLDWVEAYDDNHVIAKAVSQGYNATWCADQMLGFISDIKAEGRKVTNDFVVVAQNSPYLIDRNPNMYTGSVDAYAGEDTWFSGQADAGWNSPLAGDIPNTWTGDYTTAALLNQYEVIKSHGLPVFTIDYCLLATNEAFVYNAARAHGLRPLVTRVSLDHLP